MLRSLVGSEMCIRDRVSPEVKRRFLFYAIDRNRDGVVDLSELRTHLAALLDSTSRVAAHIGHAVASKSTPCTGCWFRQCRDEQDLELAKAAQRRLQCKVEDLRASIPALATKLMSSLDIDQNSVLDMEEWTEHCSMDTSLTEALARVADCNSMVQAYLVGFRSSTAEEVSDEAIGLWASPVPGVRKPQIELSPEDARVLC
eukprot:TRINITY_DN60479_c0_g1_i1.p1 TRINITY_DN60479_c0_g1~~TRINITY_DN60479_c0_g1_i1.p1  ORF type:complete len:201 (+),score=55.43 TRINITY_DN60479_c0_g1_i1:150-752(+)